MDVDIRNVTASFGSLLVSNSVRNRFMSVDVRVGDYHLDSSNFISEDGFQGFLGSTGQVGIDRDYSSLRQDLWLATDQAYKSAVTQMSLKQAFQAALLNRRIDDFSSHRSAGRPASGAGLDVSQLGDQEARAALRQPTNFPVIYGNRVNYSLIYVTTHSDQARTTISTPQPGRHRAYPIRKDDGMPLHNGYYATYVARPGDLPGSAAVGSELEKAGTLLMELRQSPLVPDYTGPVLFDAPPPVRRTHRFCCRQGRLSPLSMTSDFDAAMNVSRAKRVDGARRYPRHARHGHSYRRPHGKRFSGKAFIGKFRYRRRRHHLAENHPGGKRYFEGLHDARRPRPDFQGSNATRSADLQTPPHEQNLPFQVNDGLGAADMQAKFVSTPAGKTAMNGAWK